MASALTVHLVGQKVRMPWEPLSWYVSSNLIRSSAALRLGEKRISLLISKPMSMASRHTFVFLSVSPTARLG